MNTTHQMGNPTQRMTIGDFLLRRLEEAGIRHLFGVPGDYNLALLQQLHDGGTLEWVGNTGELVSSYAADGYARLNGLGALLVTNAVGSLSAINGVAGSYAEHVPTICICGSIPLRSVDRGLGMHHTMADGNFDHFLRAYAPVTAAQARITPRNAVVEIDRLILTAWREKLPVYMELPSDITYLEIEVPSAPLVLAEPPSDPERLRSSIDAIAQRLSAATSPAILVDADAARFGVAADLMELARKVQAPVAVINAAKSVIDESFPHYIGIYAGRGSEPGVREVIESSDCLLAIGYRPIEVTTGDFTATLPAGTIHARGHAVDIGDDNYQAVTLKEVLRGVIETVPQVTTRPAQPVAALATARESAPATAPGARADGSATLTQAAYWQAIQDYLRPGDVIYVDNGTSIFHSRSEAPGRAATFSRVDQLGVHRLFGRRPPRCADRGAGASPCAADRRWLLPGHGAGTVDHPATRSQAGHPADQQRGIHDRARLYRQERAVQRRRQLVLCRPAESTPPGGPGAIVRGENVRGSARSARRAE